MSIEVRSPGIFLAFIGQDIEQEENVFPIADGYECWNLKKFRIDDFVRELQRKIPPVNDNVLRNYKREETAQKDGFGVTEKIFGRCSWGLLIPDALQDAILGNYPETLFLLNLYSPRFLHPVFYATDFGISDALERKRIGIQAHQNQSDLFRTARFVSFYKTMLPQSEYGTWTSDRAEKWKDEDWRLFVAGMLFTGLKDYENGKTAFGWQRESADMGALLECLFTAGDSQNEEVGYRLRKRVAVLLAGKFPTIEDDIKKLYNDRSAFVHGAFYARIAKDTKKSFSNLPLPDFGLLYRQKEYVRWALVAYLRLAQLLKADPKRYGTPKVTTILENAIIDINLRGKVLEDIAPILSLLPD